jgi:hypothetical protein
VWWLAFFCNSAKIFLVPMIETEHKPMTIRRERMRLDAAVQFVNENKKAMPSDGKFSAKRWACVDGRIADNDNRFTAPGGALGIKYAVMGGLQTYEKKHGSVGIAFDRLTDAIESKFGGMSFHTDTHAIANGKTRISGGCGHCSGALEMAEEYGLEHYAHLLDAHIDEIKYRVSPEILFGSHNEEAVFVIAQSANGKSLTLPGTGKDGRQAFICHLEDWLEVVSSLAYEVVKCATGNVDAERLSKYIKAAAKRQLGATLRRLAEGLPVYRVSRDQAGAISVELIAEDAAKAIA